MDTQATEVRGQPAAPQNNNVAEDNGNVTASQRVQSFIKRAETVAKAPSKSRQPPPEEADAPSNTVDENEAPDEATPDDAEKSDGASNVPAEKTPPETESAAEPTDDVLSQFSPHAQAKLNKRFAALTAKGKAAEEKAAKETQRAEALTAELAQVRAQLAEPKHSDQQATTAPVASAPAVGNDLAANVNDEAGLQKLQREASFALNWLQSNYHKVVRAIAHEQEAVEIDGQSYSIAQIDNIRNMATTTLQQSIPQRAEFLKQRNMHLANARNKFPEFFDRSKPEYQQIEDIRRQYPQFNAIPNHEVILGYAMKGLRAEAAEDAAAKSKTAPKAESKAPSLGDGAEAPSKVRSGTPTSGIRKEIEKAKARYEDSGSHEDRKELMRLESQLRAAG